MAHSLSSLDPGQVQKDVHNEENHSLDVSIVGNLVPERFDKMVFTYIGSGPAVGEIETVTYSLDAVQIAVLTLTYTGSDLTTVERTA